MDTVDSWCYENGVYDHNAMRYALKEKDAEIRTDESHRKDWQKKEKNKKPLFKGVEGFLCFIHY